MRIDAVIGPVTLVFERDKAPRAGERFKVAVFVADKAMGVAHVTYEQWVEFCQASPQMRSAPTVSPGGPFKDYRTFEILALGTAQATAEVKIDVPIDFFIENMEVRARLTKQRLESLAETYFSNLAHDGGLTIDWDFDPVDFVACSGVKLV